MTKEQLKTDLGSLSEYIENIETFYTPKEINGIIQSYLVDINFEEGTPYILKTAKPTQEELEARSIKGLIALRTEISQGYSLKGLEKQIIKMVLDPNINFHADKEALLSLAVERDEDTARFLVECGADYNARAGVIISKAIKSGFKDFLRKILDDGHDFPNNTPLKHELYYHTPKEKISQKMQAVLAYNEKENGKVVKQAEEIIKVMQTMKTNNDLTLFPIVYKEIISKCPKKTKPHIEKIVWEEFSNKLAKQSQKLIKAEEEPKPKEQILIKNNSKYNSKITNTKRSQERPSKNQLTVKTNEGILSRTQVQEKWDLLLFSTYYKNNNKKKITNLASEFRTSIGITLKEFRILKLNRVPVNGWESQKTISVKDFIDELLINSGKVTNKYNESNFLKKWDKFYSEIKENKVRVNLEKVFNTLNANTKTTKADSAIRDTESYLEKLSTKIKIKL